VLGLVERLPDQDPLLDEADEDEGGAEVRALDYREIAPERYPSSGLGGDDDEEEPDRGSSEEPLEGHT
jgi:hypothetical protein